MKRIRNLFLFKKEKEFSNPHQLVKASPTNQTFTKEEGLRLQLETIDKQTNETIRNLIEAQTVNLRSYLNRENGFWANIQRQKHRSASMNSLKWHWHRLKELLIARTKLQWELNKITSDYWPNKVRLLLKLACLFLVLVACIGLIFMGVMTTLYFLPIWGAILLFFLLYKRTNR